MFVVPRIFHSSETFFDWGMSIWTTYFHHPDLCEILKDKKPVGKPFWEPALLHALSSAPGMEFPYCPCSLLRSWFQKHLKQQFTSDCEKWSHLSTGFHLTALFCLFRKEVCRQGSLGWGLCSCLWTSGLIQGHGVWLVKEIMKLFFLKKRKILGKPWEMPKIRC